LFQGQIVPLGARRRTAPDAFLARVLSQLLFGEGGMMRIWYHGTTEENAAAIMKTGFRENTYFASGLQDAISYGGHYVFEAAINFGEKEPWQIKTANEIPPDWIISLRRYEVHVIHENEDRRQEVFDANEAAA
jgi:hypothetical protein